MVGLFGKTSAHGDFIKHNTSASVFGPFSQWLIDGTEALKHGKTKLPATCVGFLYADTSHAEVLVGAFIGSSDTVGRSFPLALFTAMPATTAAYYFSVIPRAFDPFLGQLVNILLASQNCALPSLIQQCDAIIPPGAGALQQTQLACDAELANYKMADLQKQLGQPGSGQHYYAFHALLSACKPLRGRGAASSGTITLDCPVGSPTMSTAWLELVKRTLAWPVPPSFFWTSSQPHRLLIPLGKTPAAAMGYITGGDPNASKRWPLLTSSSAAIGAARAKLPTNVRMAIDSPNGSFDQVLAALRY